MIKTAVILAAGLGSRLREKTEDRPKGFLEIDNKPIIEYSILNLIEKGIEKIVIGTGYLSEVYEQLAMKYPQIQCVYNPKYASSGSMYTLFLLKEHIHEDFVLLESDLLYEKIALTTLFGIDKQDIVLSSGFTYSGDEVFIETNKNNELVNMSKNRDSLNSVYSELVGITKLSLQSFYKMCAYAKEIFIENIIMDYEAALVGISKDIKLSVHKMTSLVWCEVDEEEHWKRAVEIIFPKIRAREKGIVKRNILLNPGPATTTDTVKYAQIVADICPREKEFAHVMDFVSTELTKLVGDTTDYTTILFGGSGTAAVESILSSVINQDTVVIINNGAYGERMCQIASVYKLRYLEYKTSFVKPIDIFDLEQVILRSYNKISHLAMVHNETTTGLLNDIEAVGQLCEKYNILLIVDAMSSFAAIPINMKKMNISFLAASSNKNLQGMAGVSFVISHIGHLEETLQIQPRNFYLHLFEQYHHLKRTNQMRFTPPVQTIYALKQAIIETKNEGIKNRYKRYCESWEVLIDGITRLGLSYLVPINHHSKIITSIIEPSNRNYNFYEMHDFLYSKGYTIYPGKLDKLNTFRVANIGDITSIDMKDFIKYLEIYLNGMDSYYGGE